MKDKLLKYIETNKDRIIDTFNILHSMPEVGFAEKKTSAYLAKRLEELGYSVERGVGGTGVIGIFDTGIPGPWIGLRADMDALIHEVNGESMAIHSCGHDANCAIVISVAEALVKSNVLNKGHLRIIFQPAEETLRGAKELLKSGYMNGLDYLIAGHLRPIEELPYGKISPSVRHGASGIMLADITGSEAHGGRPHQGVNVIDACCLIVFAVNSIHMNPQIPYSVKATMIKTGGNAFNIIPGKAKMAFDLRVQTNEAMEKLKEAVEKAIERGAQCCGAEAECHFLGGVPAAKDSDELIRIAQDCIKYVLGEDGVADCIVTSGGEDFHEYSYAMKELKTTILGIGADLVPGLHKPNMTFNQEALLHGAKVMALMVYEIMK